MHRSLIFLVFLAAILICSCVRRGAEPSEPTDAEPNGPPLEIKFLSATSTLFDDDYGVPSCGPPKGRMSCYDPETGVFHVRVNVYGEAEVGFEITKVSERITKPVTFRLTRVPPSYGCVGRPLAFSVKGKHYPLVRDWLGDVDETLFRVEVHRDAVAATLAENGVQVHRDAVVVSFTEKGQKLLEPGARIGYSVDNNW